MAAGEIRQLHIGEDLVDGGIVLRAGSEAKIGNAAHQNGIEHGQLAKLNVLGYIGDPPCPFLSGKLGKIFAVHADFSALGFVDAQDVFEQGGFAGAVFAQDDANLALLQLQGCALQNGLAAPAIGKVKIFAGQHLRPPFRKKIMAMKKGAPSKEVTAPTGSAEPLPAVLARVSAISSSRLPERMVAGMVTR